MSTSIKKYFAVTGSVIKNITYSSLNKFIWSLGKGSDHARSGQSYENFLSDLLNNNILSIEEFHRYLLDELFFGQQRSTYIKKIFSNDVALCSDTDVIRAVNHSYQQVTECYYNSIITTFFTPSGEKSDLVAFEIIKDDDGTVRKIRLLFAELVEVKNSTNQYENSYIPIEIDLVKKYLITKTNPKTKVVKDTQKPEFLANTYTDIVTKLFGLQFTSFKKDCKRTMYAMSKDLFNQIYEKMIKIKPKDIDKNITLITEQLSKTLSIRDLDKKMEFNNFFNLQENISNLIENILICDVMYYTAHENDYTDVNGLIVYLKFNDGKNVNARLKGENCKDTILNSETFLVLRGPIDNAKSISVLQVRWIQDNNELRVKYEAIGSQHLHIHYYRNLNEGDFLYGIQKFEEFESTSINSVQGLDSISTDSVAK